MTVKEITKDEVIEELRNGRAVHSIHTGMEKVFDLKERTITEINAMINSEKYIFFVVEKED